MKLEKEWITGFVDGEGCFHVSVNPNKSMALKVQVLPEFTVVQHVRDVKVLYALKNFFQCGIVRKINGDFFCYRVRNLNHIWTIIIPFFEKHPLKTIKRLNYLRFRWIIQAMLFKKYHLNSEGLEKIIKVKNRMNKYYKIESSPSRQ